MQLDMKLGNKQVLRQQLSLNADMLQSLEILRLPIQQLREVMIQKSYDNPLLELEDSAQPSEAAETGPEIPAEGQDTEEVLSVQALRNDIWSAGAAGEDAYFAAGTAETSFTELLNEQVGAVEVDDAFAWLCRYLIACLDRRGYFTDAPEEVAKELCCKSFDVTQALYFIQALEPAGVGARSLEECLLLQLMRGSHFNAYTIRLVKDGLPLLADGNIAGIARLLGLDRAQTLAVCAQVRALHPIPSRGYYTGEARGTIIPDATVEKTETGFTVVYNRRLLPTLKLNAQYVDMMEASGEVQVRDYLQRNLSDARQFIRAVEKREDTFTRILTQIVLMQPQFFSDGAALVPMTMEMLATTLDMNVSTVSRAVQGKYIKYMGGTVELKRLFTAGIGREQGAPISAVLVKHMIQEFIRSEDAQHPLSDESLCQALNTKNIHISRRTVAKYRAEIGIDSASRRRAKSALHQGV